MMKAAESTATASATILVVDDDPAILDMLYTRLSGTGYEVVTATDGDEALVQARASRPALVVLDVMMPRRNGWEVARALRQEEATRDTKIVMLTAIGPQVNEMTSPIHGADAYLDKPFDFKALERIIGDLLG